MAQSKIHKATVEKREALMAWYGSKHQSLQIPIYSSYDIRDAGYKVTNVDANIYPAGFNNICPTDKEHTPPLFKRFIDSHYGADVQRILLITEEHTKNPYYWDNVWTIQDLLQSAGREVMIGFPSPLPEPLLLESATGKQLRVVYADLNSSEIKKFNPQLIISNNDFSNEHQEWAAKIDLPMNPPRELGWYQRKKSRYFKFYNQLVEEFSSITGIDPFLLNVKTELFEDFDLADENSRNLLATRVDAMLEELRSDYKKRGIAQEPFVFVKNNSGTYGLAVIRVGSGDEVKAWTYKDRKKMKAAKGGRDIEEVIIQEGIPSVVRSDGASAEPVIYMVGCELAGGFLRTHNEKSGEESLNSPGAVYKRLCVADLGISVEGCPLENVYGWSAKLGLMAIAMEAQEMGVQFQGFKAVSCGLKV